MLYGAIQSGYLPGGYTPAPNTPTFNNTVEPETLLSYTIGFKSRLFDGLLTINNEAYYYDYKHYQVVAINVSTGVSNVFSAQKARIYGDQLNIALNLSRNTSLSAGLGLMSTKFTEFALPDGRDFSGNRLSNASDFTLSLDASHRFDLASGGGVTAQVHSSFDGGYFGQYDNTPEVYQKHFNKTDLSLTYHSPGDQWSVRAWVLNIGNTAVLGAHASVFPGLAAAFPDPPRTYGVSVQHKW